MEKLYKVAMTIAVAATALSADAQTATMFSSWSTDYDGLAAGQQAKIFGISTSGNYAVGFGDVAVTSILWNKEGNVLKDIYSPDEDLTGKVDAKVKDVSDNGTSVGLYYSKDNMLVVGTFHRYVNLPGFCTADGVWKSVEIVCDSSKLAGQSKSGDIVKISGDGKLMGGYMQNETGTATIPALWDGEGKLIQPLIPSPTEKFFIMTAMSDDGKVIAGYSTNSIYIGPFSTLDAVIYINGEWSKMVYNYPASSSYHRESITSISDNGLFACGYIVADSVDAQENSTTIAKGFIYDVTSKSYTFVDGILPSVITNDGTMYGRNFYDDFIGQSGAATAVRYSNGEVVELKEWLMSNYNLPATEAVFSDVTAVSEVNDGEFLMAVSENIAGGMYGAEKFSKPYLITISEAVPAVEEYVTSEVGTVCESDLVKVTYFDTPLTNAGTLEAMTSDGKQILGSNGNNTYIYNVDDATLRRINCPEYQYLSTSGTYVTAKQCNGYGLADNGLIIGNYVCADSISASGEACDIPGYYKNGKWTALERLGGVALMPNKYDGCARAVSADGRVIVGAVTDREYHYQACTWSADGKLATLLPGCNAMYGGMATSVSADGSVICGWLKDAAYGNAAVWMNNEVIVIGSEDDYSVSNYVTRNGKYVVGQVVNSDTASYMCSAHGFVYDTESKTTTINLLQHPSAYGNVITSISEDGKTMIGYSMFSGGTLDRAPFIIIDNAFYDLDAYLKERGFVAPMEYANNDFFTPLSLSKDCKTISGILDTDGQRMAYVIELKDAPKVGVDVYGFNVYSDDYVMGMAKFNTADAANIQVYAESEVVVYAGAYATNQYYLVGTSSLSPWSGAGLDLMTCNYLTGETNVVGTFGANYALDMSYDTNSMKMYALTTDDATTTNLAVVDLTNGSITSSISLADNYVALAANNDGILYAIKDNGDLCILNAADGSATVVGSTGLTPTFGMFQDAEFNSADNNIYWMAITNDGASSTFCEVNSATGEITATTNMPQNNEVVALYINNVTDGVSSPTINRYANTWTKSTVVEIYTLDGTFVKSTTGDVNLSGLSANLYVVKMINGNNVKTLKVLKK